MKVDAIPGSIMQMAAYDGRVCKKVHSPDNTACEGFFGRLKNEMFYNHHWKGVSIPEFVSILNDYPARYNGKRIPRSKCPPPLVSADLGKVGI